MYPLYFIRISAASAISSFRLFGRFNTSFNWGMISERFVRFEDFDMFEYDLENDDLRHDIAIEGLCWFSMRGRGQTIRITLPKGAALKESLSKVR